MIYPISTQANINIYIYIYIMHYIRSALSGPYIVFYIFSQTMFASSSRYLLFKPYFFHDHGQEELSLWRFPFLRLTYCLFTRVPMSKMQTIADWQSHLYTKTTSRAFLRVNLKTCQIRRSAFINSRAAMNWIKQD